MNYGRAILGGLSGSVAVTFYNLILRWLGMHTDIEMILGTMFGGMPGIGTWWIGFGIHVLIGIIFGIIYAFFFELGTRKAGWAAGLKLGTVHAFIAGLFYGLFPQINPIMPRYIPAPGYFMSNLGAPYMITFIGMYLLFGLIMGMVYKLNGKIARLPIELEET
jgi:hypothetical protein